MPSSYHHGNLREELLARAIVVLNEIGVEGLSLRALARDLGVSHAAPLRHFKTKSDLLAALALEGIRWLIERTKAATTAGAAVERLGQMCMAYVEWAEQHPAYHHVLRNPDVMRHAPDDLRAELLAFADLQRSEIKMAQQEGWRGDIDPEVLLLHLMAMTAGTAIVMTDPVYEAPRLNASNRSTLDASFRLFFS